MILDINRSKANQLKKPYRSIPPATLSTTSSMTSWKMGIFQLVDLFFASVSGVTGVRIHGAEILEDDPSMVVVLVDIMNGDAADPISCCDHRLVHLLSKHALAPVFGQEGRMDIDDPAAKCLHKRPRYLP